MRTAQPSGFDVNDSWTSVTTSAGSEKLKRTLISAIRHQWTE